MIDSGVNGSKIGLDKAPAPEYASIHLKYKILLIINIGQHLLNYGSNSFIIVRVEYDGRPFVFYGGLNRTAQ
jgi:hypothetical protein